MRIATSHRKQGAALRPGFTMIEVLLAIGIFSFVLVAIYASWSAIMRGTRIGLTAAAEVQRTRIAIRSLEDALAGAVMYSDNPLYYGFYADTAGEFGYLSFVARLPESFPGSGLFIGKPIRRVTFRVDENRNLLLSQSGLLDLGDTPYTITLAPKTSVFSMEFFNPRMNEWIPEWIATNALPSVVRVAIDFGESKKENITLRSIGLNAMAIARVGAAVGQPPNPGAGRDGPGRAGGGRGARGGGNSGRNAGAGNFGGNMGGGNFGGGEPYNGPRWNGPPNLPPGFGSGAGGGGQPARKNFFPQ